MYWFTCSTNFELGLFNDSPYSDTLSTFNTPSLFHTHTHTRVVFFSNISPLYCIDTDEAEILSFLPHFVTFCDENREGQFEQGVFKWNYAVLELKIHPWSLYSIFDHLTEFCILLVLTVCNRIKDLLRFKVYVFNSYTANNQLCAMLYV